MHEGISIKGAQYLSQSAIAECVTEFRPPLNRLKEQHVIAEQFNRGLPVSAPDTPREGLIVPSQRKTVHRLFDPPLLVDDPSVVSYEQIEKLLPSFVALQAVDRKTLATIVVEVCTA
jgi:hypothetical protein